MKRAHHFLAALIVALVLWLGTAHSACAFAQAEHNPTAGQAISPQPPQSASTLALRANSTLVLVPVSVSDASNRFVLGLDKQNFKVYEDGIEQKISQFAGEDAPLSVGLLIDTSGSMGAKIDTSREAVQQFLKTMNAQDEAFLVEFSDRAELSVAFTHDPETITDKLKSVESRGLTALLDAADLGLKEMKRAKNPRKALLIISDGGDNNSRYTASEITKLVREADVQVYSMGVFERFPFLGLSAAEISGPKLLSELSNQTGGRTFSVSSFAALPNVAKKIGIELRNQYILAYAPSNHERDGKYRRVEVKLQAPEGLPTLKARWRLGYYAPTE